MNPESLRSALKIPKRFARDFASFNFINLMNFMNFINFTNPESLRSGLRFAQLYKLLSPAIIVAHRIPSIADETMPPA
jgi:hypothetical protein